MNNNKDIIEKDSRKFLRVCSIEDLPKRFGKRVEFDDGSEIAIFDIEGELFAVDNICPHQRAPLLYEGKIEDCTVTCPLHSWRYDLRTGEVLRGGAAHLTTYEVFIEDGTVIVEIPKPTTPKWME